MNYINWVLIIKPYFGITESSESDLAVLKSTFGVPSNKQLEMKAPRIRFN